LRELDHERSGKRSAFESPQCGTSGLSWHPTRAKQAVCDPVGFVSSFARANNSLRETSQVFDQYDPQRYGDGP
jgi:hypothetical protein